MGQKTDARIFRQGINKKNWDCRYIAKNNEESSLFLYRTLEVQKYLNRFFALYKVKTQNCKIFYSYGSLQVYVSLYATAKTIHAIRKNLTRYSKKLSTPIKRTSLKKKSSRHGKRRKNQFQLPSQKIRLKIKKIQKVNAKQCSTGRESSPWVAPSLRGFQEILLESLIKYTKRKIDVSVTLQNLNRHKQLSYSQLEGLRRIFKQLRKFVKNPFFREAMNILFINISRRKCAKLLAEFISDQFRLNQLRTDQRTIPRKDNYFLGFIKQAILLFIGCEASCLTGVKIAIKGRFNRAPRARTTKIYFGKFSLQSFRSKVDYHQSTAYTINGTFGVKVWLRENAIFENLCGYSRKKQNTKKCRKEN